MESTGDLGALGATIASLMGLIPDIAALFSIAWFTVRIVYSIQEIKKNKDKKKDVE